MGRAADGQQQHQHALVIDVPVGGNEAALGVPAHGDAVVADHGPRPFDPFVDGLRLLTDFRLVGMASVEVAGGEEHAADQQGRIDGGQFVGPVTKPRLHIQEVVEEALVPRRAAGLRALRQVMEEAQRRQGPLTRLGPAHPAALDTHRPAGQGEPDRRHRTERRRRPAIRRETSLAIRDLLEPPERPLLKLLDLLIQPHRPSLRPIDRPRRRRLLRRRHHRKSNGQSRRACGGPHQEVSTIHGQAHWVCIKKKDRLPTSERRPRLRV